MTSAEDTAIRNRLGHESVVAVYRRSLLPLSETFIRAEALALQRYSPIFVGRQREEGLDLPRGRVVVGMPGGSLQRAIRCRLPMHDADGRVAKACRARGVKLVYAHFGPDGLNALELARRLDVPLIVKFHGFDATMSDDALAAAGGITADYVRRRSELFDGAAMLVAVSHFLAGELRCRGAPESKLRVHHVGVPLGPPPKRVLREPVVLFVGRHVEKKGLGDLIEAMAQVRASVPSARLVVVGDGPLRRQHQEHAQRLELNAEFVGWLTPGKVAEQLRRVRVVCVPSRRAANGDAEGLPTVIPEAGASGLPVVGTRHSGIPEAISDGRSGLLASEGDIDGIARRLIAVLSDSDLWWRLSTGARENLRLNFDPEVQAAELESLYDEVLSRSG